MLWRAVPRIGISGSRISWSTIAGIVAWLLVVLRSIGVIRLLLIVAGILIIVLRIPRRGSRWWRRLLRWWRTIGTRITIVVGIAPTIVGIPVVAAPSWPAPAKSYAKSPAPTPTAPPPIVSVMPVRPIVKAVVKAAVSSSVESIVEATAVEAAGAHAAAVESSAAVKSAAAESAAMETSPAVKPASTVTAALRGSGPRKSQNEECEDCRENEGKCLLHGRATNLATKNCPRRNPRQQEWQGSGQVNRPSF